MRVWLGLDGGTFKVTLPVAANGLADRADLRIGQDILAAHFIRLDFRRRTSELVLRDRLASETRALIAIPIDTAPDGTILVPVQMSDGTRTRARLQFNFHVEKNEAQTGEAQTPIAILGEGDVKVFEIDDYHVDGATRVSKVFIDLLAFSDQVIILDLPHNRLSGQRAEGRALDDFAECRLVRPNRRAGFRSANRLDHCDAVGEARSPCLN